jgi:hypothetical protein
MLIMLMALESVHIHHSPLISTLLAGVNQCGALFDRIEPRLKSIC